MNGSTVMVDVVPAEAGVTDTAKKRYSDHLNARGKTDAFPPVFVAPDVVQVLSHLRSTGKAFAEFRSTDLVKSADLTFVPFYRIYEEHYAVYFPVMTSEEWRRREGELNADRERRA